MDHIEEIADQLIADIVAREGYQEMADGAEQMKDLLLPVVRQLYEALSLAANGHIKPDAPKAVHEAIQAALDAAKEASK